MLSVEFRNLIAPKTKVLYIIWGAITLAPVMYILVAWFLFGQTGDSFSLDSSLKSGSDLPLKEIGVGLLLVLGFSATFYQKKSFSDEMIAQKMSEDPVWTSGAAQLGSGSSDSGGEIFLNLSDREKRLVGLWAHYQTTMIVVWALLESLAVVGLILAILQEDFRVVLPFAAAAFALMILKMPRPTRFFAAIK